MAVKIVILALLVLAAVYVVYRASDYYFTKREREDRIDARLRIYREARDAGIWADDDPDSFDRAEYERAAAELGIDLEER